MGEPAAVRVAIVDDHQMFAESLSHVLGLEADLEVVGVAPDGPAAMDLIAAARPDVALVDFRLPGQDGVAVTAAIKAAHPQVHVIMLTAMREEQVGRVIEALAGAGLVARVGNVTSASTRSGIRATVAPRCPRVLDR